MKIIDVNSWKRKIPYENFIKYSNPIFSLSTRLDVTLLCKRCKEKGTSFFADFLWLVMKCLNGVEELRLRIYGGNVVLYDVVHPSYIVLSDDGVIQTCRTGLRGDYAQFYKKVREDISATKKYGSGKGRFNEKETNDTFYFSCMPWVDLTSMSNPYDYADAEASSIPRITWGKYVEENGRMRMMIDIAAHHALLDGEPVCRAFVKIQEALNNLGDVFD